MCEHKAIISPGSSPAGVAASALPVHWAASFLVPTRRTCLTTPVTIESRRTQLVTTRSVPSWIAGGTGAVHPIARITLQTLSTPTDTHSTKYKYNRKRHKFKRNG